MGQIKNRTGQKYGHWIVKEQDIPKTIETKKIYWICECECGCGLTKSIRSDALSQVVVGGCDKYFQVHPKICAKCKKEFFAKKQAKTRKYCYECVPEEGYDGATMRKRIKQWALEYKGGKCQKCGYDKYIGALELHHLNPNEKEFNLSDRNIKLDWETIKKELDKCILVCANCHREIHGKEKEE